MTHTVDRRSSGWVGHGGCAESGAGVCRFRWRCLAALYEKQIDLQCAHNIAALI